MTLAIISHRQSRDVPARSFTVGELIDYLQEFDPEELIVVKGYDGYLYNSIDCETIEEVYE